MDEEKFLLDILEILKTTTELSDSPFDEITATNWKNALWTDKRVTEIYGLIEDRLEEIRGDTLLPLSAQQSVCGDGQSPQSPQD